MALYKRGRFTNRPRRKSNLSGKTVWRTIFMFGAIVMGTIYAVYTHYIG